jgi:hypothetical protein
MPRAKKEPPQLDAGTTYVAWQSFAIDIDGVPIDVKQGTRLRGDNPTVVASWWNWVADGASPAEVAQRRRELYPEADPHIDPYEREKPPPPLADRDAVVCVQELPGGLTLGRIGIAGGDKVPRDHPDAKKYPSHFVDVIPEGVDPANAVVSKVTIRYSLPGGGEQVAVYRGQYIAADHPEVERHPARFELPGVEHRSRHTPKVKE